MNLFLNSFKLLNSKEKFNLLIIFFLITVSSILEMIGIGLILPLLTLIIDDNYFFNNEIINIIKVQLNINNKNEFMLLILILVILANLIKAIFLTLTAWKQAKDISQIHIRFTNKLYLDYIKSPWEFLMYKNSGTLLRNIHSSTYEFTSKILTSYIQIATELVMLIFVTSMLIFVELKITIISIFFLLVVGFLSQSITKKYNYKFGEIRQKNLQWINKHLIETFRSFKLIKVFNKESIFSKKYHEVSSNEIIAKTTQDIFNRLPRIWIEFLTISVICIVIIISSKYNENFTEFVPLIGLFVAASYKLLPSLSRILNTMQSLRFAKPAVDDLQKEIEEINKKNYQEIKKTQIEEINFNKNIIIENISYTYGNSKIDVFKNFTYEIKKDKVLGVIGASGSGKSTLIDLLMGIINPQSGNIYVDDKNIKNITKSWQRNIGYVPQDTYLLDESIKNNIAFGIPEKLINIK
jgi:ATP-binding cassette subfamily C protein